MLHQNITRRTFLAASAAAAAALSAWPAGAAEFRGRLRKAMIINEVTESRTPAAEGGGLRRRRDTHICPEAEAAAGRAVAEKLGMRVHSVLRGWMEFNSEDPQKVEASLERRAAGVARRQGLRRRRDPAGALPRRRHADARAVGVRHRLRREDRPCHARRGRRQRQVRGLHRGPEPRHRHLARGGREADSRWPRSAGRHRPGERLEQPLGQAGALRALRRLVRQPVGQVLFRHRQPREVRAAAGLDQGAGQADRRSATSRTSS